MHLYEVGKPYSATRTRWPEGADYNYRDGSHELRLFFRDPSKQEIQDVGGEKQFALWVSGNVIVLVYKLGTMPWSDQPYSIHLTELGVGPQEPPPLYDRPEDAQKRAFLQTLLVNADTGYVLAMNAVTFSPEFTRALHKAIHDQASRPWPGNAEYNLEVAALQRRFPHSEGMLPGCIVRCVGGRD